MLEAICSGGQRGADLAGLRAAKKAGLRTYGWMPLGWITIEGPRPDIAEEFNLLQCEVAGYPARIYRNVRDADATIRLATSFLTRGESCTLRYIKEFNKPYRDIDLNESLCPSDLANWIIKGKFKTLNIAGNSDPAIEIKVEAFLRVTFNLVLTLNSV